MKNLIKYLFIFICVFAFTGCSDNVSQVKNNDISSTETIVLDKKSEDLYEKANNLYKQNDFDNALKVADEAVSYNKNNYKVLSLKGLLLAFGNNPDEGIKLIDTSLKINPNYTQGFYEMAIALKLAKRYQESIVYFNKVIDKDPENTWSYYGISTDFADMNNKKEALFYLKKAIDKGGIDIKKTAATQDHFMRFHGDPDFETLVAN